MHIMEGYLPVAHAAGWWVASAPFVVWSGRAVNKKLQERPENKLLLGACGGFVFVMSALKIPSVTGSCSHPTGMGFGSILFGPSSMIVLGMITLLFQAMFLAHGGLTTLGANVFSMAIVGSFTAYLVYGASVKLRLPAWAAMFLAAALSDLATYIVTSFQLALAFPDPASGVAGSFVKFAGVFALTQIPLAVGEGIITASLIALFLKHNLPELRRIGGLSTGESI